MIFYKQVFLQSENTEYFPRQLITRQATSKNQLIYAKHYLNGLFDSFFSFQLLKYVPLKMIRSQLFHRAEFFSIYLTCIDKHVFQFNVRLEQIRDIVRYNLKISFDRRVFLVHRVHSTIDGKFTCMKICG
jgi:hypothetical protein